MRVRTFLLLIASLAGLVTMATAAAAGAQDGTTTTTTDSTPAEPVGIGDGFYFTGAAVTPPDGGEPRTMNAYQAAVFVQSWLPSTFFGDQSIVSDPPADLPVSKVVISGTWGTGLPTGTMTVYFATNGETSWVAFPQDQPIATDPSTPAPEPADWFTPPSRVLDAFNGTAELIETTGTQTANPTTTAPGAEQSAGSSSDGGGSVPAWAWAAVAAVGGALLVGFVLRRRRAVSG